MIDIKLSFSYHQKALGAVAHLARAIEWHSIGSRFDPDQLQTQKQKTGHERPVFCVYEVRQEGEFVLRQNAITFGQCGRPLTLRASSSVTSTGPS